MYALNASVLRRDVDRAAVYERDIHSVTVARNASSGAESVCASSSVRLSLEWILSNFSDSQKVYTTDNYPSSRSLV
jgi:hypothetical protein